MIRRLLAVVALVAMVSGCRAGGQYGDGVPTPEGQPQSSPAIQESRENRLPEGFPEHMVLPGERRITYSLVVEHGYFLYIDTPMAHDRIRAFYATELPGRGWTIELCQTTESEGQPMTIVQAYDDRWLGLVTIARGTHKDRPFAFNIFVASLNEPRTGPAAECPQ